MQRAGVDTQSGGLGGTAGSSGPVGGGQPWGRGASAGRSRRGQGRGAGRPTEVRPRGVEGTRPLPFSRRPSVQGCPWGREAREREVRATERDGAGRGHSGTPIPRRAPHWASCRRQGGGQDPGQGSRCPQARPLLTRVWLCPRTSPAWAPQLLFPALGGPHPSSSLGPLLGFVHKTRVGELPCRVGSARDEAQAAPAPVYGSQDGVGDGRTPGPPRWPPGFGPHWTGPVRASCPSRGAHRARPPTTAGLCSTGVGPCICSRPSPVAPGRLGPVPVGRGG